MGRDFLAFWKLNTVEGCVRDGELLLFAGSNQYNRVDTGDTVWIVTTRSGELRLVGRIVVDRVCGRDEAVQALGTSDIWPADTYILAAEGTALPAADIDIHALAPDLQFNGPNSQLALGGDGSVNGQQLQTMRQLAGNSAQLLADTLDGINA